MDNQKIGALIYKLRKEHGLTQLQLAGQMKISDKTVSKWERGQGCPDVSLLPELSRIFSVNLEAFLSGELEGNDTVGGNMKKLGFYVCPECGNLMTAAAEATISCCGKKLQQLQPQKAEGEVALSVEVIDTDYFVSGNHEMTREHYVSMVAFLNGDTLVLRKLYPEWTLQTRIPRIGHGKLFWYCTRHGLMYQIV